MTPEELAERALAWYAVHGRDLPWRRTRDPYAILVSEVMLQQTQVDRVIERWTAWLERWPTAADLAAAPRADVIAAWQGLGYNRRAVALHEAARMLAEQGIPQDQAGWRALPGVGPYTAAAICARKASTQAGARSSAPTMRNLQAKSCKPASASTKRS